MVTPTPIHELRLCSRPGPHRFVLRGDGSLDMERSFVHIDYFALLHDISVRNNQQPGVSSRPVDFTANRIRAAFIAPGLGDEGRGIGDSVWLYGGPENQALILSRTDTAGRVSLRYLPIANLKILQDGTIKFDRLAGVVLTVHTLKTQPSMSGGREDGMVSSWHTGRGWLRVLHKTAYSNGLIGLNEQFTLFFSSREMDGGCRPAVSNDERLVRQFHQDNAAALKRTCDSGKRSLEF